MYRISCRTTVAAVWVALVILFSSVIEAEQSAAEPSRVEVGQEAPSFELETLDGARLSLEGLRGEAPLVLIFFRGIW